MNFDHLEKWEFLMQYMQIMEDLSKGLISQFHAFDKGVY